MPAFYPGGQLLTPDEQRQMGLLPPSPLTPSPSMAHPSAPAATPSQLFSSPKGFYGPGFLANLESRRTGQTPEQIYAARTRQLETTAGLFGSLVLPGGRALGLGKQLAGAATQGAGISGGLAAIRGERPTRIATEAGLGAAGQAGGALAARGLGALASPLFKGMTARKRAGQLAQYLKDRVPAWTAFPATARGLKNMLYSQRGYDSLHTMYDDAFERVAKRGSTVDILIPKSHAEAFDIPIKGPAETAPRVNPMDPGPVSEEKVVVNASDAAKGVIGRWKSNPNGYKLITQALDLAGVGDPALRQSYKTAIGLREYLKETFPKGAGFDILKAQEGLTKDTVVQELLNRGLQQDVANILTPGGTVIERRNLAGPAALAGAAIGGSVGAPYIGHSGSGLGGALGGFWLGRHIPRYTNVSVPGRQYLDPARRAAIQAWMQSQLAQRRPPSQ